MRKAVADQIQSAKRYLETDEYLHVVIFNSFKRKSEIIFTQDDTKQMQGTSGCVIYRSDTHMKWDNQLKFPKTLIHQVNDESYTIMLHMLWQRSSVCLSVQRFPINLSSIRNNCPIDFHQLISLFVSN